MPAPLAMYNQISILTLQAGDELANKYAGAHKKNQDNQEEPASSLGPINLCLFQSEGRPNQCKNPAGVSSISVNLSIPLCVGSGVMDWFCHFCSVHSMLAWKGAGRWWGGGWELPQPWPSLPHICEITGRTVSLGAWKMLSSGTTHGLPWHLVTDCCFRAKAGCPS